jgi:polyhydroxybutyrate depolymerase
MIMTMKTFTNFCLFLLLHSLPIGQTRIFAQQRYDVKFKFDGEDREFIVVKPTGAVPAGGYPVVFMFHGTSGTGEEFYDKSKWKERGEIEKFITVFPTALKYCVLNFADNKPVVTTKWNNGNLQEDKCPNVVQNFKDDVKFIRKMVDTIKQTFNINPKKIFGSGFSNGGAMVLKLAMDVSDVFAAVAQNASLMNALDSTKPFRPIPIWSMVGSKDDRFTTPLGVPEIPFGGDSVLAYLKGGINRILVCESLNQTYTKTNTGRTNSFIFDKPKITGNTNRYIFTLVDNMFHVFPNGDNYPLVAADLHWDFFKQTIATDINEIRLSESAVQIYPNPSTDAMTIKIVDNTEGAISEVSVYNALGQKIYASKTTNYSQLTLKKAEIGYGFFVVKINQGQKVVTKRIVFQ